jgi:probable O-glycosylation ligase (exosortase A-associated)
LAAALVAQIHAGNQDAGWFALKILIPLVCVSRLTTALLTTRTRLVLFMLTVGVSLGVHGAYTGALFTLRGGGHLTAGPGGAFNDNNAFALGLVRILFFLVFAAQWVRPRIGRAVVSAMVPLCLLTILWSYSRGAFLALAAGALAYAVFQERRVRSIAVVVALGSAAAVAIPADYVSRINTITSYEEESSAASRIHFWQVAFRMAGYRPFGVGLGNFESDYDAYDLSGGQWGHARAVHNSHLQTLAETGFAGFLIFEWLHFYSLVALWRIRGHAVAGAFADGEKNRFFLTITTALFASTVAFLVGGSFLSQALNDLNWLSFAIVAAVQQAAEELLADARAAAPVSPAPLLRFAPEARTLATRQAASTASSPITGV